MLYTGEISDELADGIWTDASVSHWQAEDWI